jgi:hypothetical protein
MSIHTQQRWPGILAAILILILATSIPVAGKPADDTAHLHIIPPAGSFQIGQEKDIEIWVDDVTDLYGVDIQLQFDPALFEVVDANPGLPGVQITPRNDLLSTDLVARKEADNVAGTVWYAVTQLNPSPPVSGSGALFALRLRALTPGSGQLAFTNQQLSTRDAELIPATSSAATYTVTGAATYSLNLPLMLRNH